MNKKFAPLIGILIFLNINLSIAQNLVNVSPQTGSANMAIPIYTVTNGSLSVPVSIQYNTSGIKVKDVEGTAGMNWNLQAGGEISRQVRGLPDDYEGSFGGVNYVGWMVTSNPGPGKVASFTPQNIGDGTCSKETADVSYINSNFNYYQDTEPDLFYVNAPGLSCELIFNRDSSRFVPVSYQDIKITYSAASDNSVLSSFTITNDQGVKYVFSYDEEVIQTAFDGTAAYFSTQYNQYKNGIQFFDKWGLTSMTDAVGNKISFTYTSSPVRNGTDSVSLYLPGSTTPTLQYYTQTAIYYGLLQSISTSDANTAPISRLTFNWNTYNNFNETGQSCVSSIAGYGRQFNFTYSLVSDTLYYVGYGRFFLRNFTDVGNGTPINYTFSYYGESPDGLGNYQSLLPDSSSVKTDYWGYPNLSSTDTTLMPKILANPSNSAYSRYAIYSVAAAGGSYSYSTTHGQNRSASTTVSDLNVGCLFKVYNSQGGSSTITYEPNTYVDVPSGAQITGGGVRVKTITDYNGLDSTKNIVRNYTYNAPGTSITSGKPLTLPSYAFTIPYSGSATGQALWDAVTVLSKTDLSSDDHSIIYGYFTMSQTGAGSTQYHLSTLGTNWDSNIVPICTGCSTVEWNPTVNLSSRTNCSLTYGPVKNDIYSYPFLPSLNFDFERGLPISVINLNDAGQKVSETDYTYQQYIAGPNPLSKITGFHTDNNPNGTLLVKGYNLYSTYFNAGELTATVTKQVYDSQTPPSSSRSSTVRYLYNSAHHELPTAVIDTNSDNSISTTKITYVKDYPVTASSANPNINALYNLQLQNINAPVETYRQVNHSGTTLTTGASLTLFSGYTTGSVTNYLPSQQFKMFSSAGEVFSPFSINTAAPSISKDAGYFLTANFDNYDNTGALLTADDGNKHYQTTIPDHNVNSATASVTNTLYNKFAFANFDTNIAPPANTFTISGTGFTANGSHNGNAYGLNSTQTVSVTVSKDSTANNYSLSFWANAPTGSNVLSMSINGSSQPSYTFTGTGSWQYYEAKISVSSLTSPMALSFTSNHNISIDDILFYPDVAEVTTLGFDPLTGYKVAATNTNGVSEYYTSDLWGRLLFQYDQDKNIVQKKTYVTAAQYTTGIGQQFFTSPSQVAKTFAAVFRAGPHLPVKGVNYKWNFGDGTTIIALDDTIVSHTYTTAGTYSVTLTTTHPMFTATIDTESVVVLNAPPALIAHLYASGVQIWDNNTNSADAIFPVYPCAIPSDNVHSKFTICSVDNTGYGHVSYQWQQSLDNGTTWTNVGTGVTWSSANYSGVRQHHYLIQCIVSASGQASSTVGSSVAVVGVP